MTFNVSKVDLHNILSLRWPQVKLVCIKTVARSERQMLRVLILHAFSHPSRADVFN